MKTTILAALSLIAVSCSTPEENDYNNAQDNYLVCGVIKSVGEESGNDFILVQFGGQTANNYHKYLVANYMDYKINSEICDFTGLTELPY